MQRFPAGIRSMRPCDRACHRGIGCGKRRFGEMSEWFKERAWKVRIPQKGIVGSNPAFSATNAENQQIAKQTPSFTPKNVKSVFLFYLR